MTCFMKRASLRCCLFFFFLSWRLHLEVSKINHKISKENKEIRYHSFFSDTATIPRGDYVQMSGVLQTGGQCSEKLEKKK